MSKFEWMELETLGGQIAHSQKRLEAARATQNFGLVQLLEREIAETEERRARVLADLTRGIDVPPSGERHPAPIPVGQVQRQRAEAKAPQSAKVVAVAPSNLTSPKPGPITGTTNGDTSMWDKLTPADLERVKRGLATRRSEMLNRHAEELKALETEQTGIDDIERAIAAFTQKFKLTGSADVVPFEAERVPVQAG